MLCKQCFRKRSRKFIIELLVLLLLYHNFSNSAVNCARFRRLNRCLIPLCVFLCVCQCQTKNMNILKSWLRPRLYVTPLPSDIYHYVIMFWSKNLMSLKVSVRLLQNNNSHLAQIKFSFSDRPKNDIQTRQNVNFSLHLRPVKLSVFCRSYMLPG